MNRRRLITALLAGTTLTGCLDGGATDSPPATHSQSVDCPPKPDSLDAASAGEYAVDFEKAYRVHELRSGSDLVGPVRFLGGGDPAVEESGDGYVVTFSLQAKYAYRGETETATAVVNGPEYWVAYFLNGTVMKRARATESGAETPTESPAPRTEGEEVSCPPSS